MVQGRCVKVEEKKFYEAFGLSPILSVEVARLH
jgi:hypothetical protein